MNIEQYVLSYRPTKLEGVSFQLTAIDKKKNKAIKYPHRILYIVKSQKEFVYVGETKAEIKKRFERSFSSYRRFKRTGKTKNGYMGYKWIKLIDPSEGKPIELNVYAILFSFDNHREEIEAIEAEVVWEIRRRTNKWPTYQNEIHFNNNFKNANTIANTILENIK